MQLSVFGSRDRCCTGTGEQPRDLLGVVRLNLGALNGETLTQGGKMTKGRNPQRRSSSPFKDEVLLFILQ